MTADGLYRIGGTGGYGGHVMRDRRGTTFNMNGRRYRKQLLVLSIWSPELKARSSPNVLD